MKPKGKYDRLKFLCGALGKLLEGAPESTVADESRNGEWIDTVERLSRALAMELGTDAHDGMRTVLSIFAELAEHEEELDLFFKSMNIIQPPNPVELSWLRLLAFAKQQARTLEDVRATAGALVTMRDDELKTAREELKAVVAERDAAVEELNRAPKRFKTFGA